MAAVLLVGLSLAAPAWAAVRVALVPDVARSTVGFVAQTSLFDAEGRFDDFELDATVDPTDLTTARVVARVRTETVDSGVDLRDRHLVAEDFFDSSRFPFATLRSRAVTDDGRGGLEMTADVTIRDVTKRVRFPLTVTGDLANAAGLRARGSFELNRREVGINYDGGALMPTIYDDVRVFFDVQLSPSPETAPRG